MIIEAPPHQNVIVQRPGEMHGQPLDVMIQNSMASAAIVTAWTILLALVLAWTCWWAVRSRRRQES
jgi:hypothetical protein